ncbi:MAG: glycosyltransferase family 9 protein [Actinomycetota bacterium]|nr:glycosyltransferase family 9 protein [Actinomycetota bacterium]
MSDARGPHIFQPARPLADPSVRRVAVVRLRVGLGDLLASVPALRALRQARPDAHVTLVTWPEVAPVIQRQRAYVDELLAFPGHPGIPERPPWPLDAFVAECRRREFDLAIQMHGRAAAANEVNALVGARRTSGFVKAGAIDVDLATHLPYPERQPEVHRHLELVRFLGVPAEDATLEFPLDEEDRAGATALLGQHRRAPYVVFHVGATAASRRWPPERFAVVADRLAGTGRTIVLVGVEAERDMVRRAASAMTAAALDLCGRTSLGELGALLADADLVVGNDSGPAHLAIAVGTPTVTVYLAGDPLRWAPRDNRRHRVIAAHVTCRPCTLSRCPIDFRCATAVDPGAVADEALHLLAS